MRYVAAVFSEHLRNVPSFVGLPRMLERDLRAGGRLLGRASARRRIGFASTFPAFRSTGRDTVGLHDWLRRYSLGRLSPPSQQFTASTGARRTSVRGTVYGRHRRYWFATFGVRAESITEAFLAFHPFEFSGDK